MWRHNGQEDENDDDDNLAASVRRGPIKGFTIMDRFCSGPVLLLFSSPLSFGFVGYACGAEATCVADLIQSTCWLISTHVGRPHELCSQGNVLQGAGSAFSVDLAAGVIKRSLNRCWVTGVLCQAPGPDAAGCAHGGGCSGTAAAYSPAAQGRPAAPNPAVHVAAGLCLHLQKHAWCYLGGGSMECPSRWCNWHYICKEPSDSGSQRMRMGTACHLAPWGGGA